MPGRFAFAWLRLLGRFLAVVAIVAVLGILVLILVIVAAVAFHGLLRLFRHPFAQFPQLGPKFAALILHRRHRALQQLLQIHSAAARFVAFLGAGALFAALLLSAFAF